MPVQLPKRALLPTEPAEISIVIKIGDQVTELDFTIDPEEGSATTEIEHRIAEQLDPDLRVYRSRTTDLVDFTLELKGARIA